MAFVVYKIVSGNQFGFIHGRHIEECKATTMDCVNFMDKPC